MSFVVTIIALATCFNGYALYLIIQQLDRIHDQMRQS